MSNDSKSSNIHEVNHEPIPLKIYVGVFVGLLVLTALTVGVSYIDFRGYDLHVALAVALVKASLVVLYFMNLRYDHDRINAVIFLIGLFFLMVFIVPTFWDHATRATVDGTRGEYTKVTRPGYPPGVSEPAPEAAAAKAE